MDNQHKKISGYRDLNQTEIDGMNSFKEVEKELGKVFMAVESIDGVDQHMLALAKINLKQGFMWAVRSIAKPSDPFEV